MTPYQTINKHWNSSNIKFSTVILAISLLLGLISNKTSADDSNKPIAINSDTAKLDKLQGTATYSGNVILRQGSLKIKADKIVIIASRENQVERVIATGKPAQYQQKAGRNGELTLAKGNHIVYYINRESLSLTDNAEITQPGNATITGDRIQYDIREQTVTAGSNPSKSKRSRVEIIIEPKKRP